MASYLRERTPDGAHHSQRPPRANVVHQLLGRERLGGPRVLWPLARRAWTLRDVALLEEQAVVLGFSSDGLFLLYYAYWGRELRLFWRDFEPSGDNVVPEAIAVRTSVGPFAANPELPNADALSLDDRELHVWQNLREPIVVAIACSPNPNAPWFMTLTPAPLQASSPTLRTVSSLRLRLATPHAPKYAWAFLGGGCNQLLLHLGATLVVLGLELNGAHAPTPTMAPWYAPSEYALDMVSITEPTSFPKARRSLGVQAIYQWTFDVETFLRTWLDSVPALAPRLLLDYALALIDETSSLALGSCYMACVLDVAQPRRRLALFIYWNTVSGAHDVLRVLQRPPVGDVRTSLPSVRDSFQQHLARHVPMPHATWCYWSNGSVLRRASLRTVSNPVFPFDIHLS